MFEDQNVELLPARTVMTTWGSTYTRQKAVAISAGNFALLSGNQVQLGTAFSEQSSGGVNNATAINSAG